jgi:hypothetical protein
MTQSLQKPEYTYRASEGMATQFKRLLVEFLAANGRGATDHLARALGCRKKLIERWIKSGPEVSLTSRYLTSFELTTGISLDRLMVIQAKREIVRKTKSIDAVRRKDPPMAFLLARDPNLANKIDFENLPTRKEIVLEVQIVSDEVGVPTIARELMLDARSVATWFSTSRRRLPANETLERAVIMTTIGFLSDGIHGKDDARFRVCAYQLLGRKLEDVLGVSNLKEALTELFQGMKDDPKSVIANRTGIGPHNLNRLSSWEDTDDNGRMTVEMQGQVLRALVARKYPDRLDAFDTAMIAFLNKENRYWVGTPVFSSDHTTHVHPSRPGRDTATRMVEERPAKKVADEPGPLPAPVSEAPASNIPIILRIEFARTVAALGVLLQEHPELSDELPLQCTRIVEVEVPREVPVSAPASADSLESSNWFIQMAQGNGPLTQEETQRLLILFQHLPDVLERLLLLPEQEREQILRLIDPGLVNMQGLLDAAASAEPNKYREQFLIPQRQVVGHKPS